MMRKFLISLISSVVALGFLAESADARRLGGAKSFGMQRQATQPAPTTPTQQAAPAPAAPTQAAQPSGARSWMGPLAGLAAGLGLAALFSHLGLGEEFGAIVLGLLLALAVVVLLRALFRRPAGRGLAHAGAGAEVSARTGWMPGTEDGGSPAAPMGSAPRLPPGFDTAAFARQAKLNFIRMQAANDAGNLADLREFTTPEVFAEVQMQISERGAAQNQTDVVTLDAEVLEAVEEADRYIVSVRFSGTLREQAGSAPEAFDEIWHLTKPMAGGEGWVVAGIQQVS